ncbi:MAG TPA: ABC transporter ATP-binding protein [Devosia sp.]|nr:ABC transporter ATP-binding protein [Devosia sp.]
MRDLRVQFGRLHAVSGISLDVWPGEFLGIVGESGSGKSVAARSVINLLPSSAKRSGDVFFEGRSVFSMSEAQLKHLRGGEIGFVFQDAIAALDPVYTIGTQLMEVLRAGGEWKGKAAARQRALDLLAEVGIADPERCFISYPHQLSGGMKQRVVIAAALISNPKLIVADEPTTALDVTVQKQVLELLQKVAVSRGVAVILITHDLGVVAEVCHRVAVFYGGLLVEETVTETLFNRPRHPYTAALIESLPRLGRRVPFKSIPGSPPRILAALAACPFQPRCSNAVPGCTEAVPAETGDATHRFRCLNPRP